MKKDTLTKIIDPIRAFQKGIITMEHLNLGMLILGGIMFVILLILFLRHSKALLKHISDLFTDPVTNKWSPKIVVVGMASVVIFLSHIVWLKYAFVNNDFTQLQPILMIDYGFITIALGLRTIEKMQAKKIDGTPDPDKKDVV